MSVVSLKKVSKKYGDLFALKDVNIEVEKGEFVSIMGPSGSGKTTLLNLIGCLDKSTSGHVFIDGVDTSKLTTRQLTEVRRDKIGLIFQQFHLIPHLSAVENVMLAQYYHSLPDYNEACEALKRVGLGMRLHHLPNQLSGGEQQRVCIARALINHPQLILADEPTGNLDEKNENKVIGILSQLHQDGHSIILVTHDPAIGDLADRKINLEHGKIVTPDSYHAHLAKEQKG